MLLPIGKILSTLFRLMPKCAEQYVFTNEKPKICSEGFRLKKQNSNERVQDECRASFRVIQISDAS